MTAVVAALVAHKNGHSWERLGEEIVKGISLAMSAILILLMVGALIGVWNMSGTIATIVYYGIKYIDPAWFYFAAALLTGLVGLVTGSSWTTAATLGVAFVGIGKVHRRQRRRSPPGRSSPGAYFGDKMTPLSETTILTPQIVGSNVYDHIRSMAKATIPAYLISLVLFFLIGEECCNQRGRAMDTDGCAGGPGVVYNISLWNLLPILVLLLLGIRKYPAFLSILIGALAGALVAVVLQPQVVVITSPMIQSLSDAACPAEKRLDGDGERLHRSQRAIEQIDDLFTGGGMSSMLTTVWLILGAMSFGAMMDLRRFKTG